MWEKDICMIDFDIYFEIIDMIMYEILWGFVII